MSVKRQHQENVFQDTTTTGPSSTTCITTGEDPVFYTDDNLNRLTVVVVNASEET